MNEREDFRKKPEIATIGGIFDHRTVAVMRIAAGEINQEVGGLRFVIKVPSDTFLDHNGRRLPNGQQRVLLTGSWVQGGDEKDADPLWVRVNTIKKEFGLENK